MFDIPFTIESGDKEINVLYYGFGNPYYPYIYYCFNISYNIPCLLSRIFLFVYSKFGKYRLYLL